jgi:signal transduction histidine kinase
LLNLILNAQQAMPHGGQLVVRTTPIGSGVAMYLIDSGCGMDERTRSQIFNVFYSTKPGGSGLGLPTTKKIVEAHGGRILVESEPGRGTRFTVELPVPPRLTASPALTTAV